jgi:hypothetical protein
MDPTHQAMIVALKSIRDQADSALKGIEPRAAEQRSLSCGHVKHFTRPVPSEVASPCPKCGGARFDPV